MTAADFAYDDAAQSLTVNTDKHFALQTDDQTISDKEDESARTIPGIHKNPVSTRLIVPAGREAHITLAGVGVRAPSSVATYSALDIAKGASCHLVLADGTQNSLVALASNGSGIHNPEGAALTIDDSILNQDRSGNTVVPENGFVPADITLANGTKIKKGDPLTVMDSENPGSLVVWCTAGISAAIGGRGDPSYGTGGEDGGAFTMNGGLVTARSSYNYEAGGYNCSAGIGGGGWGGNGTGLDDWITINGGRLTAIGSRHGAGVGSGNQGACGNIRINGGYVISKGGDHGSGFGAACIPADSSAFKMIFTGGTLIPSTAYPPIAGCGDIGAPNADITITGGSIGNGRDPERFTFEGSAHNAEGEPIKMIQVDLTSDVGESAFALSEWELKVDGVPYDYGAPAEFDKGHLYLWLPERVVRDSEVTVEFTYLDTDKLDESGNPTPVTPLPLFRPADSSLPPGVTNDGKLRRYVDFELDADYLAGLSKYYDGEPFPVFPLPLRAPDGRDLTEADKITFKYQRLDPSGNPVGAETDNGADVGAMTFTAISTQYSDDTEGNFSESYWGHRATGRCEIRPIGSQVAIKSATWENGQASSQENPSDRKLSLTCAVRRADTDPSGAPTKATCAAPQGYIQLFVDGKKVGDPIEILFADKTLPDGTVLPANATASGDTTTFTYTASPAEVDHLVPVATPNGRHVISVQYLPPNDDDAAPANYLASASPIDDPGHAPEVEVAISPIDPNPAVTPEPDPDCTDPDAPEPEVSTGPGQPADPGADPGKPGDKVFRGEIVTTWGEPDDADPHPGRVLLKVDTPSSGPIEVTDARGNVFEADFLRGNDGEPVRGEDGSYTLVLDPTAVGKGQLTFRQEPNGAYTGSTWVYDVTVLPRPEIAPAPALAKRAENLTHPGGPTQPGDRIRYTITASNTAAGSLWMQAVATDPLPACLDLDEKSLRLDNPRGGVADRALEKAPSVAAGDVGRFSLSTPAADGRPVLTVPVGNVAGGASATVTFECTVRADAAGEGKPATDLGNVAQATGTRPDPADPERPMPDPDNPGQPLPVNPDPTDPATPPGPGHVVPADPVVDLTKTVENVTAPDAGTTHIGDVLRYTVTLANTGAANSCLVGAVVSDPLPAGLEPVAGTLRLAVDGGAPVAVPDAAYDRASRTIAVTCGDMWGGSRAVLTFDATVGAEAAGADNGNVAHAHGSVPSKDPGTAPTDPEPGRPATPPSGEPETSTPPVLPPTVVPDDPDRGDVTIEKTAENTSRDDGTTHVGDTVRYRVELANGAVGTGWMDAVIRDDVPEGLEPMAGTLRLTLPDGSEVAVDDAAYDPATRILAVACGHLYGGQRVTLAFDALVTEAAVGADIGNVAVGLGTPPSAWDPDGESPEPGAPFDPPEGWDAYDRSHGKVVSEPAYPPGVDRLGGVVPGDLPREKERTTIAHKLAQTGDALAAAALLPAALALAAGAALLASRRRRARSPR
ncbi:DUF11 domain-containing protein [Adlercreutzia caecimuris]|uniref:DUF11 domain-containing protein n=1 Tax=Adlercreutzia caecimuris TaxID=671266 RepID=UPI0013728D3F|nr:DUF11 domain-containing protein [Adlercreutzia caecimuris]